MKRVDLAPEPFRVVGTAQERVRGTTFEGGFKSPRVWPSEVRFEYQVNETVPAAGRLGVQEIQCGPDGMRDQFHDRFLSTAIGYPCPDCGAQV